MAHDELTAGSLDELRALVRQLLCDHEQLVPDQFQLSETPLLRGSSVVGLQFVLSGPRSLRLNAIWDGEKNLLYAYDARGERFAKRPVTGTIELPDLQDHPEQSFRQPA